MTKATKRISSFALAASILVTTALPTFAADSVAPTAPMNTAKEEVVYINLSHDGRVDTMYVVNSFEPTNTNAIIDFGHYSNVKNLTTTADMDVQGDKIMVDAPDEKFYYQGTLEDREMPWNVSIEYLLDGKPIAGESLAGQSGHLEMFVKIRKNPNGDPLYHENFALQANLQLDSEKCKNIDAPDATLANVGDKKQMSYIILPDKEKDFHIAADVVDFEMDGMQINGIPMNIDIDDPDTAEIKDRVQELIDGAIELDDGAIELDDGATKLDDGVMTLQDGVSDLREGVDDLVEGADDLHDGTADLVSGVNKLSKGATELRNGTYTLASGANQFGMGLDQLNNQSNMLNAGVAQINQALQQVRLGLSSFDDNAINGMIQQSSQLQAGSQQYLSTLDSMIVSYQRQLDDAYVSLGFSGNADEIIALEAVIPVLQQVRDSYVPINGGVNALTSGIMDTLPAMGQLIYGIDTIAQNFDSINTGIMAYTNGVGQLNNSFGELTGGIDQLSEGTDKLHEGTGDLSEGAQELHEGTFDLQEGVYKLDDGTTQLGDGVVELKDGTIELVDGTHELRDETADMDSEIDDKIDDMLEEYRGKDFDLVSFVSPENVAINSLQFVIKTPEVKMKDAPVVEQVVASFEETATFWDRVKNLFV